MSNLEKNAKIKENGKRTRERHSEMKCRVFQLKVIKSKLNAAQRGHINAMFCEAKWFRNAMLNKPFEEMDYKTKTVRVKVGEVFEEREVRHLSSQMRQSVIVGIRRDIFALNRAKKIGLHVGQLKYKSVCNCIPLNQYKVTYRIDREQSTISIQGMKCPMKVRGMKQFPDGADITNGRLVRRASGLYIEVTTFTDKVPTNSTGACVGLDFGIGNNITTSDGELFNIKIPETRSLKKLSRKINKAWIAAKRPAKKSNNHYRRLYAIERKYERMTNQKKDLANKVVHKLLAENDFIGIQDEMIANWHKGLFGKQVQHSAMGLIKAKLRNSFRTIVVPREFPSTQICPICGEKTRHPLSKRDYDCASCGYHHDSRDVKSAQSILTEALKLASM